MHGPARLVSDFAMATESKNSILSLVPAGSAHRVQGQRTVALPGVTVDILTTRKIELQQWELRRLNDPYWRLYWPVSEGGVVEIDGGRTALKPGHVYLIPPHTTFSTTTSRPSANGMRISISAPWRTAPRRASIAFPPARTCAACSRV
jgi:hypothetical protein